MNVTTAANQTLDPLQQVFTINLTNGNQFSFSLSDLDEWYLDALYCCIQYACQLGASALLLIVLLLLTKVEKRTNVLFLLNSAALVFNFLRLLLACCYFTGPFNEVYTFFSLDFGNLPSYAYGVSIASEIFTVLLFLVIQVSLLFQIQVVCINIRKKYRSVIMVSSGIICSAAAGMKSYLAALNIQGILNPSMAITIDLETISKHTDYLTTATITWFSTIFVAKLGYALYQRKNLGLRQWGSMQIIFIMGCQTMIVPAIFSIIQHNVDFPAVSSFVYTLVALFLPLSSLWATTALQKKSVSGNALLVVPGITPDYGEPTRNGKHQSVGESLGGSTHYSSEYGSPIAGYRKESYTSPV